jgi:hypothetical protein
MALPLFMRLSLQKGEHAALSCAAYRKSGGAAVWFHKDNPIS